MKCARRACRNSIDYVGLCPECQHKLKNNKAGYETAKDRAQAQIAALGPKPIVQRVPGGFRTGPSRKDPEYLAHVEKWNLELRAASRWEAERQRIETELRAAEPIEEPQRLSETELRQLLGLTYTVKPKDRVFCTRCRNRQPAGARVATFSERVPGSYTAMELRYLCEPCVRTQFNV